MLDYRVDRDRYAVLIDRLFQAIICLKNRISTKPSGYNIASPVLGSLTHRLPFVELTLVRREFSQLNILWVWVRNNLTVIPNYPRLLLLKVFYAEGSDVCSFGVLFYIVIRKNPSYTFPCVGWESINVSS